MKYIAPFVAALLFIAMSPSEPLAVELAGYQPPAPFGVMSAASTETPEPMQSAVAFTLEKVGGPNFNRYSTQLAIGVSGNMEMGINMPYYRDNTDEGMEDITFSFKHRFFDEGTYGPSFAYILTSAKSSNNDNLSSKGGYGGGLVLSKRIGPLMAHANVFYKKPGDEALEEEVRAIVGGVFAADHNFNLLAEVIIANGNTDSSEARLGYRFVYGNRIYSTLAVGMGFDDEGPDYRIMLSFSLMFPKQKTYTEDLDRK